jgi:protein SCO1
MKKLWIIGIVVFISAGAFVALTTSAGNENVKENSDEISLVSQKEEKHSCCAEETGSDEYSDNSIYQLNSEWTDQNGTKRKLDEFRGKSVVFTMFFASCTYACPILVEDMKKIESKIPAAELDNFSFVLVSIDPERDTPEKLKAFSNMKSIDEKRWTLLTGTEDDIMELAALTGFKYKKESDGQFSHSNIINIMNEEGEITYQHLGLNQDITIAANYLKN